MNDDDILKANDNNKLQGPNKAGNSNEKSTEEQINIIIKELNNLINDISNSRQISEAVAQTQAINQSQEATSSQSVTPSQGTGQGQGAQATDIGVNVFSTINQTALTLVALNSIKTELCRLPLDFCEMQYINNCILPFITAMELLSRTSYDLSTSVSVLTTSPIVPRKKGKLRDTIHTIYSINEEVEDLYKVLKKRFKNIT